LRGALATKQSIVSTKKKLDCFASPRHGLGPRRFPFDKIKIDRGFVKGLMGGTGSPAIIKAVVSIATDRDMTTTAEGVETTQRRDMVQSLGCTQMQGYLFSAARPAHEIPAMLTPRPAPVEDAAQGPDAGRALPGLGQTLT
jgi:predicted signal transduction protein with EAL and GGDEF domain